MCIGSDVRVCGTDPSKRLHNILSLFPWSIGKYNQKEKKIINVKTGFHNIKRNMMDGDMQSVVPSIMNK